MASLAPSKSKKSVDGRFEYNFSIFNNLDLLEKPSWNPADQEIRKDAVVSTVVEKDESSMI